MSRKNKQFQVLPSLTADEIPKALREVQTNGPKAAFYRERLNNLRDVAAINKLCDLIILYPAKYPVALEIALANDYAPSRRVLQALFYYLTEQWEKYDQLGKGKVMLYLPQKYCTAEIRERLTHIGRRAGRSDLLKELVQAQTTKSQVVAGQQQELLAQLLTQTDYDELWRLVGEWSPVVCRSVLEGLGAAKWQPSQPPELAYFKNLSLLAQACKNNPAQETYKFQKSYTLALPANARMDDTKRFKMNATGLIAETNLESYQITLYNIENGEILFELPKPSEADAQYCQAISPDGSRWACRISSPFNASPNLNSIQIVSTKSGEVLHTIAPIGTNIRHNCNFFSDNRLLRYGNITSEPYSFILYDFSQSVSFQILEGLSPLYVYSSILSPNEIFMAGVNSLHTLWVWSFLEQKYMTLIPINANYDFCFSPDSLSLAYVTGEAAIIVDIQSGQIVRTIPVKNTRQSGFLTFSPDGQLLITGKLGSSDKHEFAFWRLADGKLLQRIPMNYGFPHDLIFKNDGQKLMILTEERNIVIYEQEYRTILERPLAKNSPQDLAWLEERLADSKLPQDERTWLEFAVALLKYRWQHAVLVDDVSEVQAAPTDIELGE